MKLHRLELEGFGPFRERQTIDFDAFADDGIFLIAGRTGAGKSSLLDGVCFALYGGVPRYDGVEKRLRSDHCAPEDPTAVALEFSSAGRVWRVKRSPEYQRPKQRGTGMTTEPHRAQLFERIGDEWIGCAARPVDVARELDEIIGLSQQQFLQVILLAQNRFAEFLLAKNDERQRLLRTLFGTRRYEDYLGALEERRKVSEQALLANGEGVSLLIGEAERLLAGVVPDAGAVDARTAEGATDPGAVEAGAADAGTAGAGADRGTGAAAQATRRPEPDTAARLAEAERGRSRAEYRAEALVRERQDADAAHHAAEAALREVRAVREGQIRRDRSRAALATIEARAEDIAHDREVLAAAERAEQLRASVSALVRATSACTEADARERMARGAWRSIAGCEEAGADGDGVQDDGVDEDDRVESDVDASGGNESDEELRAIVDELNGRLAVWQQALASEARLAELDATVSALTEEVAESEAAKERLDGGRAAVPVRIGEIDVELREQALVAGGLALATTARASLVAQRAAAVETETLWDELRAAEDIRIRRLGEATRANAALEDLLRRRLDGHAGELAAALVEDAPCAVCGSTTHPAPAEVHDAVRDGDVEAAERAQAAAADAEREAAAAAAAARAAHAEAAARAAGASVADVDARLVDATAAVARAEAADAAGTRLADERAELVALDAAAALEREALVAELDRARTRLATGTEQAAATLIAVTEARGTFASVVDRVTHVTARRDSVRALADAVRERDQQRARLDEVDADFRTRLADSGFVDAVEIGAAMRDAATRVALADRVHDHDASLRAERDRLRDLELELAGVPDEPVDVEGAVAAQTAARESWSAAVDAAARATQAVERLRDLLARAAAAHAEVAELEAEHAAVARLAHTVAGRPPNTRRMTLESFVLAAELEEIVASANLRLTDMSAGRYRLEHTDALAARGAASGLGLRIMDAYTGQTRPAQSLSGGETFLASLALALGLAEVVTARAGGVRLDALFVDEGFGSLDGETLELAMRTLDELRQGGRTVGVISHVDAMKEQLPAQVRVEATPQGPSIVRQETDVIVGYR